MMIAKKRKVDSEWQSADEKANDKKYNDEDLEGEELQKLFYTIYAESKMRSSCYFLKYVFD
jgi:hypothetical protein